MLITVKDGTGAGRRQLKLRKTWKCQCRKPQPGERYSAPCCGSRRPT